jgi:uncharacterized protein (TIGR00730 family)
VAGPRRTGPRRRYAADRPELDRLIDGLVESAAREYGRADESDSVRQIVVTALRLLRDGADEPDARLLSSALKELRHAFRVFAPYEHLRKVAVFGSARTQPGSAEWRQAFDFAERIVCAGWMVITGAGGGIMAAAQGGAGREASFGVNIRLPFEQQANEVIAGDAKLVNFRYFFTRKVVFVKEAHAIALFPGGFGTHDEGFEALTLIQTGKSQLVPVVFVDVPGGSYWREWEEWVRAHLAESGLISEHDLGLFRVTDDAAAAVREITNFYSNYHSSRYVGERLVLRLRRAPDAQELEALNRDFADLLTGGAIEAGPPLPQEGGELPDLARLVLRFDRREMGRLRALVDRLNALVPESASPPRDAGPLEVVEASFPPEAERAEQE